MRSSDETVLLEHSYQRLQKIRKKHPECYEKMKAKQKTQVRISESLLSSGNTLVLMTNLPNKIRGGRIVGSLLPEMGNRKEIPHSKK